MNGEYGIGRCMSNKIHPQNRGRWYRQQGCREDNKIDILSVFIYNIAAVCRGFYIKSIKHFCLRRLIWH